MDSVTQIVLGAAVGEAVCGKRAGNKALVWGAVAGTIPDLDVLASPFLDLVGELTFHRSLTHSVFFAVLASPLFAWLLKKIYKKDATTFRDWLLLFFLGFTTHALLDCFTTWGTRVFYPFSDYPVSFHNIFVIDPLYTVPFLICVIAVSFYKRTDRRRQYWNYAGLAISTCYMVFTLICKFYVNKVFEESMKLQHITYSRYSTKPTPFNAILWSATADSDSGYYIGYYSLFDKDKDIAFRYFPKHHELLNMYASEARFQQLIKVTDGYFTLEKYGDGLEINDLRFGQLDGWGEGKEDFTFVYLVHKEGSELVFSQKPNNLKKAKSLIGNLFERVAGKKSSTTKKSPLNGLQGI